MRSFFKDFFGGSRSGEENDNETNSNHEIPPVNEWTKINLLEYLHVKEFGGSVLDCRFFNTLSEVLESN